jgi:hypothetical protein
MVTHAAANRRDAAKKHALVTRITYSKRDTTGRPAMASFAATGLFAATKIR